MHNVTQKVVHSTRGSAATIVVLITFTLLIIVGGLTLINRGRETVEPIPQASSQVETRAYYIAQTALDRSIKELVANPGWREGFAEVPFENGVYNVKIFDATEGQDGPRTSTIPPNYVRIVASSVVEGIKKEVEAVWVNAMSAFYNTYSAGSQIEIQSHDAANNFALGRIHNNAWNDGQTIIGAGTTLYGDITNVGRIVLGSRQQARPTLVYGSARGSEIDIAPLAEIRKYENLSERFEGIDLNHDGDTDDIGLTRHPLHVAGTNSVISDERSLAHGEVDGRIGGGLVRVAIGKPGVGAIVDPRPDFAAYYELVTGLSTYPPPNQHVSTPILGDGDGHYFASSHAFLDWLRLKGESVAFCWRCAGDGRVDPVGSTECSTCDGSGRNKSIEISGVFYIDAELLDLSDLGHNLILHGTLVVADGDPFDWSSKSIEVPGGKVMIDHFPQRGEFVLKGKGRMNFTQTYRSDQDGGSYSWNKRTIFAGENTQTIVIPEPDKTKSMRDFPGILVPAKIVIEPRGSGFAYYPGDMGDERLTILQGALYAEEQVRLHGRGGWSGETMIFDEEMHRNEDDALDEPVLNVDLNDDGDIFDRVELSNISTVPVVEVSNGKYCVDINNDGMLGEVTLGMDYVEFFNKNGYMCPVLIYQEGLVLGQHIHSCEQTLVIFDPLIAASGIPFGFEVNFSSTSYQGLVSWRENPSR